MVTFVANHKDTPADKDPITSQAFSFCWGVMDSNLKDLMTGANRRYRPAQKALKAFETLLPYVEELRERGILARHPTESLREQSEKKKTKLVKKNQITRTGK